MLLNSSEICFQVFLLPAASFSTARVHKHSWFVDFRSLCTLGTVSFLCPSGAMALSCNQTVQHGRGDLTSRDDDSWFRLGIQPVKAMQRKYDPQAWLQIFSRFQAMALKKEKTISCLQNLYTFYNSHCAISPPFAILSNGDGCKKNTAALVLKIYWFDVLPWFIAGYKDSFAIALI